MNELHGGNIYRYPDCYDFSANLNPLGMPDPVRRAVIENADLWGHYPDPKCLALTGRLSEYENISASHIVCGNGADDLLWRIAQALCPKRALIAVPTFSEYRRALESFGCEVETFALSPDDGFALTERFLDALHPALDLVILCTPNNPTGRLIPPKLLRQISEKCREMGMILLSDECFLDFVPDQAAYSIRQAWGAHTVRLSAFTKTFAMPGLRLGYAVFGDAALAERVQNTGQYWSVSVPAQLAGAAALDCISELETARKCVALERAFLSEGLRSLRVSVFPSDANFLLFQAKPGLFCKMQEAHILIRPCANFEGLDGTFYRIAVRPHDENEALLAALGRWI